MRSRIDWKYSLGLELADPGFDFSVLSEFRRRLVDGECGSVLLDAMLGDATLFARSDEVEAAWGLITPILEEWARGGEPDPYPSGSWGPESANQLVAVDGRGWRDPHKVG